MTSPGRPASESAPAAASDEDPNQYWRNTFKGDRRSRFDADGEELTHRSYLRLEGGEAAGITPDSENWDFWTAPSELASGGLDLTATRPHRFAQFAVEFSSTSNAGSRLDYIQFQITQPPIASLLIAEIDPPETRLGEVTSFTYKLFAVVSEEDSGFDSIQIDTPVRPSCRWGENRSENSRQRRVRGGTLERPLHSRTSSLHRHTALR